MSEYNGKFWFWTIILLLLMLALWVLGMAVFNRLDVALDKPMEIVQATH